VGPGRPPGSGERRRGAGDSCVSAALCRPGEPLSVELEGGLSDCLPSEGQTRTKASGGRRGVTVTEAVTAVISTGCQLS
jgi:hypothetical protein